MTTDTRIEELMKKGFGKLSFAEKAELNNLMAKNLQESQAEQFNKVVDEVKALIEKNGLTIAQIVKALGGAGATTEKPYFKVPYLNSKGKEVFYEWHPSKKPLAFRLSMPKSSRMQMPKLRPNGQRQRARNGSRAMKENGFSSMPNKPL